MFRILVSDKLGDAGLKRLEAAEDVSYDMITGLSKEELLKIIPEYDALIIRSGTQADADVIAAGKNLKVIGRAGIGVDNIDVTAATMAGIIVMNTPGANSMATAEQAMALMLSVSRFTAQAHASVAAGEWKRAQFAGVELFEKTLGIIGFGRIGRLVAERAKGFGMSVIASDPFVSEDVAQQTGVTLVDLEDLYAQSDYITLHTAQLPETLDMINKDTISQMKDGVVIINAARGKLINENDLADALKSGKVKGAGIDVYRSEPPAADNPLIGLPNVVHTPHLGASTKEASKVVAEMVTDQVVAALRGTDFANSINMPFQISVAFDEIRPYLDLAEKLGVMQSGLAGGAIKKLEVEVSGDVVEDIVRAIAASILKGVLSQQTDVVLNYINAPVVADQAGIKISQTTDIHDLDYPNLISVRASWDGGERALAGVLFGGSEPRIVQVDQYRLEARPEGVVLVTQNKDVPGVIGQVGTILSAYEVNIGEWRLGRNEPGGEALSFINLDSTPPEAALNALSQISAMTEIHVISL